MRPDRRRTTPPGRPAALLLAALIGAALAVGCAKPGVRAAGPPPNLVVVSFDSLRADHLGTYGYWRDTSPNLDRFAASGVVFERAFSTTTWTLPSHASLLSSLYPEEHGARDKDRALGDNVVLLPERLAEAGYRSAGVVSVGLLHRTFGFDQGWDVYDDETAVQDGGEDPERRRTSEIAGRRAAELLDELPDGPFFLFLHDYDVHFDYQPPEEFDVFETEPAPGFDPSNFAFNETIFHGMPKANLDRLIALYDGEIRWVDHNFQRLLDELDRRGLSDDTAVVVVGDHGDEFFEHGQKGHRENLFNTTLHVPMIVRFPGGRWAGQRVSTPVSLVDVAPTLANLAGVGPDPSWSGIDLATLLEGAVPSRWIYADLDLRGRPAVKSAIRGRVKGIGRFRYGKAVGGQSHLFDLDEDYPELDNLAAAEPLRLRAILDRIESVVHAAWEKQKSLGSGHVELDAERRRELAALGYL